MLKHIKAENFKSFSSLDLDMRRLNVVIGANASGKSNLVSLFRFLRDACNEGLDSAVSLQGGFESVCGFWQGRRKLSIELELEFDDERLMLPGREAQKLYISSAEWHFGLKQTKSGFSIDNDMWIFDISYDGAKNAVRRTAGDPERNVIAVTKSRGRLIFVSNNARNKPISDALNTRPETCRRKALFVHSDTAARFFPAVPRFLAGSGVYDFRRGPAAEPAPDGTSSLEGDGSNLASALRRIAADARQQRALNFLVSDFVPSAWLAAAENSAEPAESGAAESGQGGLPAEMSGGTANLLALIVALYFEPGELAVIEDPDMGAHPSLMPRMADLLREASKNRQVIVTTHNPELVRCVDLESLVLVERRDGESGISYPLMQDDVREFIRGGVGIAELFAQNLLAGSGPRPSDAQPPGPRKPRRRRYAPHLPRNPRLHNT